jgi:hypothetical protein
MKIGIPNNCFVIADLPPSAEPRARLARIRSLLYKASNGREYLRLTGNLGVPMHTAHINEQGEMRNRPGDGFWRLQSHMEWLERKVNLLDNPPQRLTLPKQGEDARTRLDALMARITDGMFTMPDGTQVPVQDVSITDEGDLATEFTSGGFWRLVLHLEVLRKIVANATTPRTKVPDPQSIDLPTISDPHERLAALKARIVVNGQRMFRMPNGEFVPVQDVCIGDDGYVDTTRFSGSRTLDGHMTWLSQQPVVTSLGIPGVERPVERYKVLMTLIPDDEHLDLLGTSVLVSEVWIANDGRVSTKRFWNAFRLDDHLRWLESKREVAEFNRRRDADSRAAIAELAQAASCTDKVKKVEMHGGRSRPVRIQNLGDDRRGW